MSVSTAPVPNVGGGEQGSLAANLANQWVPGSVAALISTERWRATKEIVLPSPLDSAHKCTGVRSHTYSTGTYTHLHTQRRSWAELELLWLSFTKLWSCSQLLHKFGTVANACRLTLLKQGQEDQKFKIILGYILNCDVNVKLHENKTINSSLSSW
jgi:hypothetical protein